MKTHLDTEMLLKAIDVVRRNGHHGSWAVEMVTNGCEFLLKQIETMVPADPLKTVDGEFFDDSMDN